MANNPLKNVFYIHKFIWFYFVINLLCLNNKQQQKYLLGMFFFHSNINCFRFENVPH